MLNAIRLGVNIDHIATLRQARQTQYPDPVYAALIAQDAGADGITLHLREDRRHIQDHDVTRLKPLLQIPMNLEMAADPAMIDFACALQPAHCCLVPEKRTELTTEGGLNVIEHQATLARACTQLAQAGIAVSLFIDPDLEQIKAAHALGVPAIEIHTGHYADASTKTAQQAALQTIVSGAQTAKTLGLAVHAGHGLHYHNVTAIAQITEIEELNIGHAIVAYAALYGFATAVEKMKVLMNAARHPSI